MRIRRDVDLQETGPLWSPLRASQTGGHGQTGAQSHQRSGALRLLCNDFDHPFPPPPPSDGPISI